MRLLIVLLTLVCCSLSLSAQDARLAQQYYTDGEYEKAGVLYQRLYQANQNNDYYFNRYIDCLIALERYEESEDAIRKELKRAPQSLQLHVTLGNLYEQQIRDEEARQEYEKAIDKLPPDRLSIVKLAQAFTQLNKFDLAIATYEKGGQLLHDQQVFAYNLGDLYRLKGDEAPQMIENYLNSLDENPGRMSSLQAIFQRYLSEDDLAELQTQLYDRIQTDRDAVHYPELLTWVFIQRKDYGNALRQVKALDRRLKENGGRVYNLAEIAFNDKDYDNAIDAYDYIVAEKGVISSFYIDAKRQALRCRQIQLTAGYDYSEESIRQLEQEYLSFLDEFGRNKTTAQIVAELADLEAFYLNDIPKAIRLLEELIAYPGINRNVQARAKLSLGDFYLIQGERWDATLLYSQVDKAFADDLLGHEARFRNAKLSYYFGDFQWAQSQFDVLKASTSKLIANDALDLSIFIMDNLGLDTTAASLTMYAEADLLIFQNRFDEAFEKLDDLLFQFPKHALQDDVLYAKAKIYKKRREYDKAAEMLQAIIDEHADGIRADNALFELAELYENQLHDIEKAKSLYETLFIDYSGSTFAVEARKRFRKLRGDNI